MSRLELDPDRLFPAEQRLRELARTIHQRVDRRPIVSPHGHVPAQWLSADEPFTDPASLLVTPDHYVTRLLHAHGVPLRELGLGPDPAPPREVWRTFCRHWWAFRGTSSRTWLTTELVDALGIDRRPDADCADELFDKISAHLAGSELRPRALYHSFGIDVLATTDDPASDLGAHRTLAADPSWSGRVVPTFRPDRYLDVGSPDWATRLDELAGASGMEIASYRALVVALEQRRSYFADNGATATDYGPIDAGSERLSPEVAEALFTAARTGIADDGDLARLRRGLLFEHARMSSEDGLVMQLHPGVLRNHHRPTFERFGPDTGHDIPLASEFTLALRPILDAFGTNPRFRLVLFTVDETTFSRELAPLAGFYPSVFLGPPWWFLDTPDGLLRFRRAVTDTIGFYKTSGFVDDTRAFCSIPARHDVARRTDARYLAELVDAGELPLDEAMDVAEHITTQLPLDVFRLT
ncbi:MAG: glucuronate isomerase [Actinobacteria bacterium]|nr:glucuronate isomerase [Actinomycetota bacterium]